METVNVGNLTKNYGGGRGVFDVTFSVCAGEVFGFLGPNGAGKSTTIRHLMGFSRPDSGYTKIFGKDTFEKYNEILPEVGYIPGEIALPAGLTGWEFIRMMQNLQHRKNEQYLQRLLRMFDLNPEGETKRMSLGVKRKLAIVTAFMRDPRLLILDEPTSGLDPVMQEIFIDFIKKEKKRGKTILLSSHIFSEVDATCDRIAIIKDGRIVSDFIADELKHASRKQYELQFETRSAYNAFLYGIEHQTIADILARNPETFRVRVGCEDKNINALIRLIASYPVCNFTHIKETLEDYFMRYYKEEKNFGGAFTA